MKLWLWRSGLLLALWLLSVSSSAAEAAQSDSLPSAYKVLYGGVEQEFLPYFLGGYSLGAWMGLERVRVRVALVRVNMPPPFLDAQLERERIVANTVYGEFFLRPDFVGFYFGGGGGYWQQRIWSKDNGGGEGRQFQYNSIIFSGGCGWQIFLWRGLYLSPHLALHTRLSGHGAIDLGGGQSYNPQMLLPEISLKIGWRIGQKFKR